MSILIFSAIEDIHARAIAWSLNRAGIETHIVSTINFPSKETCTIDLTIYPKPAIKLISANTCGLMINPSDVTCCWRRRAMGGAAYYDFSLLHEDDLNNAVFEVQGFLNNYWMEIRQMFGNNSSWVNKFSASALSGNKFSQLKLAKSIGFSVPNTIMSNDPKSIRKFHAENNGNVIFKPFYQQMWQENEIKYRQTTFLITTEHLHSDEALQACPGIYQNHVKKKFELRVVVMGEDLIAAKLDSQGAAHTAIDWRLDSRKGSMRIEPYHLSVELREKILLFMKTLDLKFGSIDFIITKEDEIVFLEINEQGQFLFLDRRCPELGILGAMCHFLAKESGSSIINSWPTLQEYEVSEDNKIRQREAEVNAANNQGIKYVFA